MKKLIIYRIFALFFALYLPAALVGVPLHKHYCEGQLEDIAVIFEADSCHDDENSTHGCCESETTACHAEIVESHCSSGNCDSGDCCEDEMELIKIEVNVIAKSSDHSKVDAVHFFETRNIEFNLSVLTHQQFVKLEIEDPPGPYPDGNARVIKHEQFLC